MIKYASKSDCSIERDYPDYPASAVLVDECGLVIHRFDDDWTDDQIWAALYFANTLYAKGFASGLSHKAAEIRAALDVPAR